MSSTTNRTETSSIDDNAWRDSAPAWLATLERAIDENDVDLQVQSILELHRLGFAVIPAPNDDDDVVRRQERLALAEAVSPVLDLLTRAHERAGGVR